MNKKGIYIFLTALAAIIVVVIVGDFAGNKPGKRPSNPYEYDISGIKEVAEEQILYKETRNFRLNLDEPKGITFFDHRLFVIGDQKLQIIGMQGNLILEVALPSLPISIATNQEYIYITTQNTVLQLDHSGKLMEEWKDFHANSLLSSIAIFEDKVFVADAGRRSVSRFDHTGNKELEFEGKASSDDLHGFIVPSGNFDLAVNEFGELWVVNPGKHALENYTFDGILRGYWTSSFSDVKGFTGCCNPAHISYLPGGNFITSEKGIIRIKEYKPSGEFVGVVAAPSKFIEEGKVPDITADNDGRVYACDPDKKSIRIFEKI